MHRALCLEWTPSPVTSPGCGTELQTHSCFPKVKGWPYSHTLTCIQILSLLSKWCLLGKCYSYCCHCLVLLAEIYIYTISLWVLNTLFSFVSKWVFNLHNFFV